MVNNSPRYQDHPHNARIWASADDWSDCKYQDSAIWIWLKQWGNWNISAWSSNVASFWYLYIR